MLLLHTFLKKFWNKRYGHIHWRLVDFSCLGYFAVLGLLLPFFHRQVPHWSVNFLVHIIFIISGLEIIRVGEKYTQKRILLAIRTFYPLAFYIYGWLEIDHMARMFYGSYWATNLLEEADKWIFGSLPSIWVLQFYSPWLDELMSIFYSSYFLFVPLATLPLFFRGKREEVLAAFSIVTFAYFINYFLIYSMPALSPRLIPGMAKIHTTDYTGYFFASFTKFVQANKVIHGGCFPSSHVTGAVVWSLAAWRYNRKVGYLLAPMALGVAISTVYLRYHYTLCPIAGLILGFTGYYIATAILKKRKEIVIQ